MSSSTASPFGPSAIPHSEAAAAPSEALATVPPLEGAPPIIQLWALRLLMQEHGLSECALLELQPKRLVRLPGMRDALTELNDGAHTPQRVAQLWARMRQLHQQAEQNWAHAQVPAMLEKNATFIRQTLGLSSTEQRLVEFVALMQTNAMLNAVCGRLAGHFVRQPARSLSITLGLPLADVQRALHRQGRLSRCGLLDMQTKQGFLTSLDDLLELSPFSLHAHLCDEVLSPEQILFGSLRPSDPPTLMLDDFAHVPVMSGVVLPYLRHALATGRKGVNVFIRGQPGTGKTQLSRVLAQALDCEMYEVAFQDEDGN